MWVVTDTVWVQLEDQARFVCHQLAGVFAADHGLPRAGTPLRFELPDGRVLLARTRFGTVWRGQAALCVDGTLTEGVGAGTRVRVDTATPPSPRTPDAP